MKIEITNFIKLYNDKIEVRRESGTLIKTI